LALIGTISGSNGTTTSAVTGSMIIAANPGEITPIRPTDVVLYVSGAATTIGADQPSILFKGDTFISGALGTDAYIQMKPVNALRIPTNTTASYIYTSGSTNDLYFTQYQPGTGYTNTTRLRWLESTLSTGLLHGGVLSTVNGTTTFSITSGSGIIIDYNASTVDEPYPTIVQVDWPAYVSSSLPNITTAEITYIAIDSTGALFKQNTAYTDGDFEDKIIIGRVLHQTGSVTNGTITSPTVAYGQTGFRGDFIRAFGPLKLSGHIVSVNGTATNPPTNTEFLGLAKTAGDSYVEGRNYTTNPNSPNYVKSTTDTALTTSKIYREHVTSAGAVIIDSGVANAGYAAIDPNKYNDGSATPAAVPTGNKFTVQRLYWFPNSVNRAIFAYYGSAVYSTLDDAETGIGNEAFTEGDNTRDAAILLGYLIVKQGATDLNVSTDAKLIQAGLSRAVPSTGGGGGSTTPGGSDTYVQYNDGGSFNGASQFRFVEGTGTVLASNLVVTGTTAGSLVSSGTFQVKSGAGAVVGSVSTGGVISGSSDLQIGGNLTGSNMLLRGDLEVNGGDLTTVAATFNLVTGSATTVNFARAATTLAIGATGGSAAFSGNITGSNVQLNGDLAVNGGDITTTAPTFNLITGSATTVNFAQTADTLSIGKLTGNVVISSRITGSSPVLFGDAVTFGGPSTVLLTTNTNVSLFNTVATTLNIGGAATTVNIGASTGRTTVLNDLAVGTGTIIGAPGAGNNVMTLISSGNIIAKLDTDASALGHKFAIQDWRNIDQFTVGENGNADVSGSLIVSGTTNMGVTVERMTHYQTTGSVIAFDMTFNSIFYVNNPNNDITANFTNLSSVVNNRIVTPTVILSQSGTARTITAVQIDGTAQTINWANGVTPTPTVNKQEAFGFSLIRSGSAWKVLGQLSSYG
jgi:hypothetical protein